MDFYRNDHFTIFSKIGIFSGLTDSTLPSVFFYLLQEFEYVFLEDDISGLTTEETKELQSQVEELISPCVIHKEQNIGNYRYIGT